MRPTGHVLVGLVGVLALSGCGGPSSPDVQVSETFSTPPGAAVTYDEALVPVGAYGEVTARSDGGSTTVTLAVRGLVPDRAYGGHAHTQPCGPTGADAGPHFQNMIDPVTPSVDPQFANPQNEIWLDFSTDSTGAGSAETTVEWEFATDRRAQSVIIHAMSTATGAGQAGTAGARAACITVPF